MLDYEIQSTTATNETTRLILLLHGRGSNRHDLFSLAPQMPADAIVVAPEAPFPAAPWGYGPGSAWYQFIGGNRPEPESFSASLQSLQEFLRELSQQMQFGPVIMGGFSQGGTMSIAYGVTHPDEITGIMNFSGFLANHPEVNAVLTPNRPTPPPPHPKIFWGHGKHDPAIPFELGVSGRAQLREAGYEVEARDYDIGHWIDGAELRDALAWLERTRP